MNDTSDKSPVQSELFPEIVLDYNVGKDELNLAEFPISSIGSRSDPTLKTLKFEDTCLDKATGQNIDRKLVITASDEYGLPTSADDEVLLGLLQISRLQKFESSTVSFTPYQLLRILGWTVSTYNYRRIRDAINRWIGVTLYYDNAWRDKHTGKWVDAKFHFIEFAELHKQGKEGVFAIDGASVIKWNELIFRNFKEGNLKTLDFHLYRSLDSGIAKRLFRFLDKRFHHRKRLVFALEAFACEKIGLTRPIKVSNNGQTTTVDVAQIKRRLMPAIIELEKHRFIVEKNPNERFTKDSVGVWQIHFERCGEKAERELDLVVEDVGLLEGRLIGHGVSPDQAKRIVSEYEDERIETQLNALEILLSGKDKTGMPENRPGWLVSAITKNYQHPSRRGPKSKAHVEESEEKTKARQEAKVKRELQKAQQDEAKREAHEAETKKVEAYLSALSEGQRREVEMEALTSSPLTRGRLSSGGGGVILRNTIIFAYVLDLIGKKNPEAGTISLWPDKGQVAGQGGEETPRLPKLV